MKRLAYADPPYLGMGQKMYGKFHPEAHVWDDAQAHIDLMAQLAAEYDGWAMSLTSTSLHILLPAAPEGSRVAAWVKPWAAFRPNHRVQYTWEPVIFRTALPKGGRGIESVRDHVTAGITMMRGLPGAKPDTFNDWILHLLGYEPGDEMHDLFPGTNGMAAAVERFRYTQTELIADPFGEQCAIEEATA